MINFTTLLNHLLLLWRFSYYLSGRRRAELESEHFERAIPLKSCSLKARCSTKNLGEGRFRCRSKKNNANFVTSTDKKKLSAFFFNACQKNKGSLNFEQSFKIQSKRKTTSCLPWKTAWIIKDNQSSYNYSFVAWKHEQLTISTSSPNDSLNWNWVWFSKLELNFIGPCHHHRDRDYCIRSNFWKFYLIRTGFKLGEPVSLVKVFRLLKLEQMFFGVESVDIVCRCTTSYLLAGPACVCDTLFS